MCLEGCSHFHLLRSSRCQVLSQSTVLIYIRICEHEHPSAIAASKACAVHMSVVKNIRSVTDFAVVSLLLYLGYEERSADRNFTKQYPESHQDGPQYITVREFGF